MNVLTSVDIGLLLPDVMGTYGDRGNAIVLRQRLLWRGINARVIPISIDQPIPESLDIYILGGAEDAAQQLATRHLQRYPGLQRAAARQAPIFAVCAGLQILGQWYRNSNNQQYDGLGLLDITTSPQAHRAIGEILTQPLIEHVDQLLSGFENHRGATTLGENTQPLGRVQYGHGNNTSDHYEGVIQNNIIGTYLHGPCLVRNPQLADVLLSKIVGELEPLVLDEVELLRTERIAKYDL